MKTTISFKTLGCRLNQYETDAIASQFYKAGYTIVDFNENPDVCIVNTCTVTNQSDQKSRNIIHQAGRKKPLLVVTGCMAIHLKEQPDLQNQISYVVPNEQKSSLFSLVDAHIKGELSPLGPKGMNSFDYEVAEKSFHTRCMVKIQDGCDNFCSFCIIPMVRGRAVSRPAADILENIKKATELGYKEMVLTGVNIGRYDSNGINFERIVEKILDVPGDFRVRVSSIEPEGFGERLFHLLGHPKMCPHLHLCLQSGSDRILLQMRRMYTKTSYMQMIDKIRDAYPSFNFTTDIIVGFPGETNEDFEETCNIIRQVAFSHVHTFQYSVRSGTRAARMTDQIPSEIKQLRSKIVHELALENKLKYRTSFLGKTQTVLTEKVTQKTAKGYGEHYVPVILSGADIKPNTFYKTIITGIEHGKEPVLKGKITEGDMFSQSNKI